MAIQKDGPLPGSIDAKSSALVFAEAVPVVVIAPVAAAQVAVQFLQLSSLPFDIGASIVAAVFTVSLVATLYCVGRFYYSRLSVTWGSWLPLTILALLFALLAFVLVRFDGDDTHYLPNAVYFLAHPRTPMGFETYYIHTDGEPFSAIAWINSYANEFFLAAIAHVFGFNFLSMYWSGKTLAAAFLIPFAWYGLLRRFDLPHGLIFGAICITLATIFIMGETFNTYGNWFITRLFHGKVIVVALGLPLMWSYMIAFLDKPGLWHWSALGIIVTAMVGLSPMAGFMLPASALALFLAYGLAHGPRVWFDPVRVPGLAGAFAYLLAAAIFIRFNVNPLILENDGILNQNYPTTYIGQLSFVTNPAFPLSIVLVVAASYLAVRQLQASRQRLILWWCLIYAGLFLNPISARILMEYVTTSNTYWRLFHAYPIPLVFGIAAVWLISYFLKSQRRPRIFLILGGGIVLGIPHALLILQIVFGWERNAPTIIRSIHRISAGGARISDVRIAEANKILSLVPPGPMLAGEPASTVIPILSGRNPQIYARVLETEFWFEARGEKERGLRRRGAYHFVSGWPGSAPEPFFKVLKEERNLKSLVIHRDVFQTGNIAKRIKAEGFTYAGDAGRYRIFVSIN